MLVSPASSARITPGYSRLVSSDLWLWDGYHFEIVARATDSRRDDGNVLSPWLILVWKFPPANGVIVEASRA